MAELIDIHVHCGRLLQDRPTVSADELVGILDRYGIERACLMSVENPEELDYYFTTFQVLEACSMHPDRLIPFCGVDPRHRYPETFDPLPVLEEYKNLGCRGYGENLAGLPIDHPLMQRIYAACGELGLPIVFHMDHHIGADQLGLPGLERMLQLYPGTIFIGHSTHFWAEISSVVDTSPRGLASYPSGPVMPTGATDRLLTTYPNLYGDLSARSGYTALVRDPSFGLDFMERQQDKLLFGTDVLYPDQELPLVAFIRDCAISETARLKICHQNVQRLLGLDQD
jgi:predicted TIM-barrel fold metal-dependent hydrolase